MNRDDKKTTNVLVVGTGGASNEYVLMKADIVRSKGARKVGPYMVTRCMSLAVAGMKIASGAALRSSMIGTAKSVTSRSWSRSVPRSPSQWPSAAPGTPHPMPRAALPVVLLSAG